MAFSSKFRYSRGTREQTKARNVISGIYEIVNMVNGKRYIGSAANLHKRLREHRSRLVSGKHPNRALRRAWTKYGGENFRFAVLLRCPVSELLACEQSFLDAMAPEYNFCPTAGSSLGRVLSAETRAKIRAKALGRKHAEPRGPDWRTKLSVANKGKPKSRKSIEKMRATKMGKTLTAEHRAKIGAGGRLAYANGKRARIKSVEHRAKISATLKGVQHSPARRAKQAAAQTGLKRKPYKTRRADPQQLAMPL